MVKKIIVSVVLTTVSLWGVAQRISTSNVDPFTKKYCITTEEVRVTKTGFNSENAFSLWYSSCNDSIQLRFYGYFNKNLQIYKGDKLVFLLDDDSMVTLTSPINQSGYEFMDITNGNGTSSYELNAFYCIDTVKVRMLMRHAIKTIRLYYNYGYQWIDNDSKQSLSSDFNEISREFMIEYDKNEKKWMK